MSEVKRTPKQTAEVVAKSISEINTVLKAVPLMRNMSFFKKSTFNESGLDELIKDVCKRNEINETHIRTVGGWHTTK